MSILTPSWWTPNSYIHWDDPQRYSPIGQETCVMKLGSNTPQCAVVHPGRAWHQFPLIFHQKWFSYMRRVQTSQAPASNAWPILFTPQTIPNSWYTWDISYVWLEIDVSRIAIFFPGWWFLATPLKNMKVHWDDDIPKSYGKILNWWRPNHQPAWNRGTPKSSIEMGFPMK